MTRKLGLNKGTMRGLVAAAVLLVAGDVFGQVIRLQREAKAELKQNVRLGDVATVSGTDAKTAESLMNLVILPELAGERAVRAETVLMAVIAQVGPGTLADKLQVSGAATCDIQIGTKAAPIAPKTVKTLPPVAAAPAPAATPVVSNSTKAAPAKPPVIDPKTPTLSKLIVAQMQQDLGIGADDLRVSFDTVNPLLDQGAPAGKRWAIRTMSRSPLGTVQVEAQLVEGSRVVQKLSVQMQVQKREMVLVATGPIVKGDVMTKSHFKAEETWSDRKMPTLLTNAKDVIGLEANRDLSAGSNLDSRDFRPVAMAAKGEAISVIFMHGNLKVQTKGRAVDGGKLHDAIQIKNEATNELYEAVLIGKRLAYVGATLDEEQEKKLREAR
jgi:flagella basal body P-ring formation protein FlgA